MTFLKKTIKSNQSIELYKFNGENFVKLPQNFHDENTIQQLGKRSKAYADKIVISSNTPYFNSIEYYEKQQFSQVKDFIKIEK